MKIILASASPRRNEMLKNLNIPFEKMVIPTEELGDEHRHRLTPEEIVVENGLEKARATAKELAKQFAGSFPEEYIVIGADTIVVDGNNIILGKPVDDDDARSMMRTLSNSTHRVITSIALVCLPGNREIYGYEETDVTFRELSEHDIDLYISTGEHRDKAGSYGIQQYGVFLVEKVDGDYFNVVGLPVLRLCRLMKQAGVDLFDVAVKNQVEGLLRQ